MNKSNAAPASPPAKTPASPGQTGEMLHSAIVVTGGTLLSRLLGFARDASIAWILGGSGTADALTAALRLPYMIRRLFGEGTLSLTLTAACVRERLEGGSGLASAVGRRVLVRAGLFAILAVFGAGLIMPLTAPGLLSRPEVLDEAALLFQICIPYAMFAMLAAVSMAELHSRGFFLLPSLTPALFNLTVLLAAVPALALPPRQAGMLLACGVLCGGLLQWLCLLPATRLLRRRESQACPPAPERVRAVFRSLPAGVLGAAVPQLAFLLASGLSSLLPEGHMASLFYAERLLEFPLGVLGAATGMAAAPRLAALAGEVSTPSPDVPVQENGLESSAFVAETARAQHLSLSLNLPAAAGLAAVAIPLVSLVLGHGAFDAEAVHATALALCAYAPGLPAYALSRPLLAACQALRDVQTPLRAALPALLVTLISGFALLLMIGPWGPPLGVSLGLWCNVWLLRRGLGRLAPPLRLRSLAPMLLGTACTFASATWAVTLCSSQPPIVALGVSIPAGVLSYAFILLIGDRNTFLALLRKKRKTI